MTILGSSDLDVFPLCLGGNVFGWTADEAESLAVLDAFVAAGGNFIDTADVVLGLGTRPHRRRVRDGHRQLAAARGDRDSMIIATKVGHDRNLRRTRSSKPPSARSSGCRPITSTSTTCTTTIPTRRSRSRSAPSASLSATARSVRRRVQLQRRAARRGARYRRARGAARGRRDAERVQPRLAWVRERRPQGGRRQRGVGHPPVLRAWRRAS